MPHSPDLCSTDPGLARILALESVPPVTTTRWIPRRKAQVVRAVQAGLLSMDEACRLYQLTVEELEGWQRALGEAGESGLRITRRASGHNSRSSLWPAWTSGDRHLVNS